MQTTKTRNGSLEVGKRTSIAVPRTGRKLKTTAGSGSSSPNPMSKIAKNRNLRVNDRRSPQSSAAEKKCPGKVSELENEIVQLQEELKKAQHEAEETKKQLAAMSQKLEESREQLIELSDSDDARLQELRKISQDRDRAWQSELEALQKQHELDSAAMASAMSEIHKLKIKLDRNADSANCEIQHLRVKLTETLAVVEDLTAQLNDSKESEANAQQELKNTQMQLQVAILTEETLRADVLKANEAIKSMASELEQSKVTSLEGLVDKLEPGTVSVQEDVKMVEENHPKLEINNLEAEISQLKAALEGAERNYQEEYIKSTLQIRSAYELAERMKSESFQRESQLEAELKQAKAETESLKQTLTETEAKLHDISYDHNESDLEAKLKRSELVLAELKARLLDKETELQCVAEENDLLKLEIQESVMHSDKNGTKKVTQNDDEQLQNSELEAELRRLKVQSNQWRKAAEAAAAMLSSTANKNGKFSIDYHNNTLGGKLGSPLMSIDDFEDDSSPKKKNGNVLKKIGVLLKKNQK